MSTAQLLLSQFKRARSRWKQCAFFIRFDLQVALKFSLNNRHMKIWKMFKEFTSFVDKNDYIL